MHLTAISTATRRASTSLSAASRYECNHLVRKSFARHWSIRPGSVFCCRSVFCSRVANLLEMPNAGFHYSVTGRRGLPSPASGHVLWYPLNDEAFASKSEATVAGAAAGRWLPCVVAPSVDYAVRRRASGQTMHPCAPDHAMRPRTRLWCARLSVRPGARLPRAPRRQATPCAQAQPARCLRSNGAHEEVMNEASTQTGRSRFEPAEERLMQITTASSAECKSMSRSRMAE
jgi:hypothetical protein